MEDIRDSDICVCCGLFVGGFLCDRDRKRFIYYVDQGFVALKPRRKISKGQTETFRTIRDIIKKPCFQEVIFPFNIFYRYDVAVPDLKLIVEYDGRQHFRFVKHFHKTKANFEKMKKRDIEKEEIAKANGWDVIRMNYKMESSDFERCFKSYLRKKNARRRS